MVGINTPDGHEIQDQKLYTVATFDYLVSGGDDLAWFMGRIPSRQISRKVSGYCRDLVSEYLKKFKIINTPENPLVNPQSPRIRFLSGAMN